MAPKVKFVHFGDDEPEIGIQFIADDGAGGTVTGRMFAPVDPSLKAAVLADAQAKLDAATGDLVALPPGQVTTALMQARNAKQDADKATARRRAAEEAHAKAEAAAAAAEAERAKAEESRLAEERIASEARNAAAEAEEARRKASAEMAVALAAVEEAKATKAALEAEIEAAKAAREAPPAAEPKA